MHTRRILAMFVAVVLPISGANAAQAPDWVRAAMAVPERKLPKGTKAHILANDHTVDFAPNGTLTRRTQHVVRILTKDGDSHAVAHVGYDRAADKLVSLKAWLISPSGKVTEFKKKDIVQTAVFSSWFELYGDAWQALIYGGSDATPGSVFAYEAVTQERSVFAQEYFEFRESIPCERSSYSVKVPKGWRVTGCVFNTEPFDPSTEGDRFTWTMRGLPATPDEVMAPSAGAAEPWLGVDFLRPEGTKGNMSSWTYASWREVSEQFTPIHNAAAAPDAAVRARADALAANAASRLEEIRALCGYVQGLNYVSINLNSASGGGMVPRAATRVLACGYGDCKDKTALLRSLLTARGIENFSVVLFAGDSERVQESWPSPNQFNHCIAAIRVDETLSGPAVVEDAALGRLLLFDPTVRHAPMGILPWNDQGGQALVLAGAQGALIRVPAAGPEDNRVERKIRVRLDEIGGVAGTIAEKFTGTVSVSYRAEVRERTPVQYQEIIEKWLGSTLPAARVSKVDPVDDFAGAALALDIEFEAPTHGRLMRDQLLVFKPVLLARRGSTFLKPGERESPVVFEAYSLSEVAEIELPAGFRIEDMIEPVEIETPFGSYKARGHLEGEGKFVFERTYILKPSVIPPSDYKVVRDFFEKVIEAEQSPVVLARLPAP